MMKRFLAMLLCLLICLSLFPAAALADGEAADSSAEETVGVSQPEDAAEAPTEETEDAVEVSVSDNDPGTPEEETPPVLPSESEEAQEPSEPAVGDAGTVPGAEMPDTEDHALGVPQEEFEDPFVPAEEENADELLSYTPGGSSEGLLDGYARMMLDSLLPRGDGLLNVKNVGATLEGATKEAYDKLRPMIAQVAAGERTSTVFSYTRTVSGSISFGSLIDALLADCPFELYWYDKTSSSWISPGTVVEISFPVAAEYAAGTYEVDPEKGAAVSHAVSKAASIVSEYSGCSDYEKLEGYKNTICDLVDYNYDALYNDVDYGNPWQLIWIFDEDPETKVVCEGYSKGFQYLCDLTSFSGNVTAYSVTGGIPGAHMWNIVTMNNGKNYLVDVTNCDSGTAGYPDYLFMRGFHSGTWSMGYVFQTGYSTIMYTYSSDTTALYDKASLILSAHDYLDDPNGDLEEPPEEMEPIEISDWSLQTLDGGTVTSSSYADRIQLLVFYRATLSNDSAMCWNSGNTVESLAQCAWISDPTIKVIAADVDGNDKAAVEAFKALYAPDCSDIVFALDGGDLMWSIARQMGNSGSVTLAVCALLVDGKLVDFWTGNYNAENCLVHIANHQGGDEELIDSGVCGQALTWKLNQEYTLTISGYGPMNYYRNASDFPWHKYRGSIRKVVVGSGVTDIYDYAFSDCSALTEASIADSVLNLGQAFSYCGSLSKVTLSKSLTSIDPMCFYDCSSLPGIVIPEGVTSIGWAAFNGCSALSDISLPESLTTISDGAFYDCTSLTVFRLPLAVTEISAFAFKGCTGLTDVYYGGTLDQREALLDHGWETQDNYLFFNATWHYQSGDGESHTPGEPVHENETAPTCTDDGWYDEVVYCSDCGREMSRNRRTIPALGHDYECVDLVWDGYSSATWYFVCSRDESHTLTLPSEITTERTEPSCDEDGSVIYTASVTVDGWIWRSRRTETLPALGHDYELIGWSWDGCSAATASFVCGRDAGHTKTVTVTPRITRTPATCERDGSVVYTASVTVSGETYTDSKSETLPALGHAYSLSGWNWTGYTAASAVFTCANDSTHRQTVAATITSERTEPTVQADGKVVYTAAAVYEGRTYTNTKTEILRIDRSPGWRQFNGSWYYFGDDGKPRTGWVKSGSSWFYMGTDGVMQTGLIKVSGKLYYMSSSGAMQTGWKQIDGRWYYFQSGGAAATGWLKSGSSWYYFDTDCVMVTGWQEIGGKKYYFNASGAMKTGWLSEDGNWYYFQSSGAMATGWVKVGTTWYYFDSDGVMVTGWQEIGGKKYYFASSGAMKTGWLKLDNKWYYFEIGGAMKTGWLKLDGKWYYLDADGVMLADTSRKIGSKVYNFNSSGVCTNP